MKLTKKLWHFFSNMGFMGKYSWDLAKSKYFFMITQAVLSTVQPFALLIIPKYILDELAGARRADVTLRYIGIYAAVIAFFNIASLLLTRYGSIQTIKIEHRDQMLKQKKWLHMDYGNFENGQVRELAGRSCGQINAIGFAENTVLGFVTNFVQLCGYTYIIMSLHPVIILFILAVIGLNTLITKKANKIGYEYQPIITRFQRRFSYIFRTMVDFGVGKDVRINGASEWLRKRYASETDEYIKNYKLNQEKHFRLDVLGQIISLVQTVVLYGYCGYLAISDGISIGSFTVFLGAITAFSGSFTDFIGRFAGLSLLSKYVDDFKEFLRLSEHEGTANEAVRASDLPMDSGDIEFCDVSFMYPNTDRYVLRHVNIKIKSGERLSVVGYNGAGKSTFIKLICRLYEPTEGKITMNGVDISTINLADYRERIAVVFQDFQLFWLSVRDNVVMNREYDEERAKTALEESGVWEKIEGLEEGIDTELGRVFDYDGREFSGGEGQKIAIARAIYRSAPIVVFDEPTSALDPIAEYDIYRNFHDLAEKRTAIYISHRLSSTRFTDHTAVFANRTIAEYGTHEELMKIDGGVYKELFEMQAQYYQE